ncbi:hypothetical protein L596_030798 [Steinernema carpocapsae]|uniref:Uncharacterized protein n=1 Tax=Steinernema carpocapsae TaxID=34508 RepID=A0A4U5LNT9_STECR|nr:hypothetical protein L596_030798 [Steinernema carpocapsae]
MVAGCQTEFAPFPLQEGNVDQPISSGFPGNRGPLKFFNLPRSAWIRLHFQKINSRTSDKYFVVSIP